VAAIAVIRLVDLVADGVAGEGADARADQRTRAAVAALVTDDRARPGSEARADEAPGLRGRPASAEGDRREGRDGKG
jgi:hypothetical protein